MADTRNLKRPAPIRKKPGAANGTHLVGALDINILLAFGFGVAFLIRPAQGPWQERRERRGRGKKPLLPYAASWVIFAVAYVVAFPDAIDRLTRAATRVGAIREAICERPRRKVQYADVCILSG